MTSGGGDEGGGWGRYVRAATQYATTAGQSDGASREPGARRRRLFQAASDLKQTYYTGYANRSGEDQLPEIGIISADNHQLWLFPSYAREIPRRQISRGAMESDTSSPGNIVEVDVRGWLFAPHAGNMGKKNRLQIGLIRWACGLPPQTGESSDVPPTKEQQEAAMAMLDRNDPVQPNPDDSFDGATASTMRYPDAADEAQPAMSPAEIQAASAAFETRFAPFTHRPIQNLPVTIFFYNITNNAQAQSCTVYTSETGHFSVRNGLNFIPTHVRVLASETLSATEEIKVHPCKGVSIISDIDDTVKHSGVSLGAREMAKATLTAPVREFIIPGVADWYKALTGPPFNASVHYISNSPWQLYPVLKSFFDESGLPPGSFHLKHYTGMWQGFMQPAAERKKATVERVMQDFPQRKWLLVGDSGEADLEVYTDMAERWPERVLAVCIRDITSAEHRRAFFNSSNPVAYGAEAEFSNDSGALQPLLQTREMEPHSNVPLPPRQFPRSVSHKNDTPEPSLPSNLSNLSINKRSGTPPSRPEKPPSLRGPPIPRKPAGLRQDTTPTFNELGIGNQPLSERQPLPLPRRNTTTTQFETTPPKPQQKITTASPAIPAGTGEFRTAAPPRPPQRMSTASPTVGTGEYFPPVPPPPLTNRQQIWERRWLIARERLERKDVRLLSWRKGSDIKDITVEIVERELKSQQEYGAR